MKKQALDFIVMLAKAMVASTAIAGPIAYGSGADIPRAIAGTFGMMVLVAVSMRTVKGMMDGGAP